MARSEQDARARAAQLEEPELPIDITGSVLEVTVLLPSHVTVGLETGEHVMVGDHRMVVEHMTTDRRGWTSIRAKPAPALDEPLQIIPIPAEVRRVIQKVFAEHWHMRDAYDAHGSMGAEHRLWNREDAQQELGHAIQRWADTVRYQKAKGIIADVEQP